MSYFICENYSIVLKRSKGFGDVKSETVMHIGMLHQYQFTILYFDTVKTANYEYKKDASFNITAAFRKWVEYSTRFLPK